MTCNKHPKYEGRFPPRENCSGCWLVFSTTPKGAFKKQKKGAKGAKPKPDKEPD